MSQHREYAKRQRRRRVMKQRMFLALLAVVFVLTGTIVCGGMMLKAHGNAQEAPVEYTYYKSIEIHSGDTLWSIAEEYMPQSYDDVQDYIADIKELNHLTSDQIHDSQYLLVSYTDTEFK